MKTFLCLLSPLVDGTFSHNRTCFGMTWRSQSIVSLLWRVHSRTQWDIIIYDYELWGTYSINCSALGFLIHYMTNIHHPERRCLNLCFCVVVKSCIQKQMIPRMKWIAEWSVNIQFGVGMCEWFLSAHLNDAMRTQWTHVCGVWFVVLMPTDSSCDSFILMCVHVFAIKNTQAFNANNSLWVSSFLARPNTNRAICRTYGNGDLIIIIITRHLIQIILSFLLQQTPRKK